MRIGYACLVLCAAGMGCDRAFGLDRAATEIDAAVPEDAAVCGAPVLIDDLFDNADLATPGIMSMGAGFLEVSNAAVDGNGSSKERLGGALELRTSNRTATLAPAQGVASNTSFAFDPQGMTIRLEVTAADTPTWNGIALALQSNQANIDVAGGSLVFRVRGPATHPFSVDVGDQDTYATPLGLQAYDEPALVDGFTVVWHVDATSWSYAADGLRADGTTISDAGTFPPGKTPAELLAGGAYLAVHIQGTSSDVNQRILNVRRMTLWDGMCP